MNFWIAVYTRRSQVSVWPIFQDESPSLEELLELYPDFANNWKGAGRLDNKVARDEDIRVDGPFTFPVAPLAESCDEEGNQEAEFIVLVNKLKRRGITSEELTPIIAGVIAGQADAINHSIEDQIGYLVSEFGIEATLIMLEQ